jgi:hypothetical protein
MTSSAGQGRAERQAESRQSTTRTVLIAGGANIIVMIAKLAAGILTGSSAMLAEAAHSFADTLNQVFLFTSVRQGQRPADEEHPFGYGQERYFWSLLAAFGIFIAGAGFSIFEGILSLHTKASDFTIAYVVLGVCAIAEGAPRSSAPTASCAARRTAITRTRSSTSRRAGTPRSRRRCSRTPRRSSGWPWPRSACSCSSSPGPPCGTAARRSRSACC